MRAASISHAYGEKTTLTGVSLEVAPREIVALLGPNGSGKSTFLSISAGLLRPTTGTIDLAVGTLDERRAHVGYCPQGSYAFADLTVREQLVLAARAFGLDRRAASERASVLCGRVGLSDAQSELPGRLSGGMLRRLNVALALVNQPKLLLLDEPSAGLDPVTRELLHSLLREERARGAAILFSTHDIDETAAIADRVAIFDRGEVVGLGTPAALLAALPSRARVEIDLTGAALGEDRAAFAASFGVRGAEWRGAVLVLSVDDAHAGLLDAAKRLSVQGLDPVSIAARRATLGDVYLSLTGRSLVT